MDTNTLITAGVPAAAAIIFGIINALQTRSARREMANRLTDARNENSRAHEGIVKRIDDAKNDLNLRIDDANKRQDDMGARISDATRAIDGIRNDLRPVIQMALTRSNDEKPPQ